MIVLLVALAAPQAHAAVELLIGSVTVDTSDTTSASCVQVPILIRDPDLATRDIKSITFTVVLFGDTSIITGGTTANMLVTNGFALGANLAGIRDPGQDLSNINNSPTPTCSRIFNPATQGGAKIDFPAGNQNAVWLISNDGNNLGHKVGVAFNLLFDVSIAELSRDQLYLLGVLEIPIKANPADASSLIITAVPDNVVADSNFLTWDDGIRSSRINIDQDLDLSNALGTVLIADVNIFDDGFDDGNFNGWSTFVPTGGASRQEP